MFELCVESYLVPIGFLVPIVFFPIMWRMRKKYFLVFALITYIYMTSYIVFSLDGHYIFTSRGGSDWRIEWSPKHLLSASRNIRTRSFHTPLGSIYWPCIAIDQVVWHKNITHESFHDDEYGHSNQIIILKGAPEKIILK